MSSHAVKVEVAADTTFVWKPASLHGTSLHHCNPNSPEVLQGGLAICTPRGLENLWAKVCNGKVSLEEARKEMLELESDEVDP